MGGIIASPSMVFLVFAVMFLSLGEKLGYLDREMQVAQLTLLEEELGYRIKTLKSAMPKQQKTYQSMGILGGILLAVLLW